MKYIDLGLPSGTLWASCNYGTSCPKYHGQLIPFKKVVENELILPSQQQFDELIKYTEQQIIKNEKGLLLISKINGRKIFFPYSGYGDINGNIINTDTNHSFFWVNNGYGFKGKTFCITGSFTSYHTYDKAYYHSVRTVSTKFKEHASYKRTLRKGLQNIHK